MRVKPWQSFFGINLEGGWRDWGWSNWWPFWYGEITNTRPTLNLGGLRDIFRYIPVRIAERRTTGKDGSWIQDRFGRRHSIHPSTSLQKQSTRAHWSKTSNPRNTRARVHPSFWFPLWRPRVICTQERQQPSVLNWLPSGIGILYPFRRRCLTV